MTPTIEIPPAEHVVMKVIWRSGPCTAREVMSTLSDSRWSTRTVRSLLHRLLARGAVTYSRRGREYVYSAVIAEARHADLETRRFLQRFAGTPLKLLEEQLSDARTRCRREVEQLAEAVRAHRAAGGTTSLTRQLVESLVAAGTLPALPACPMRGALSVEEDGQVWCSHHDPEPETEVPVRPQPPGVTSDRRTQRQRHACRNTMQELEVALAAFARGKPRPPLLTPELVRQLLADEPACPADNYRSDHAGQIWCNRHFRPNVGNGCTDCYLQQAELARVLRAYRDDSGAPLVLDPARPETMDALLISGCLPARPICREAGVLSSDAEGRVACSHHGPIQDQLVWDGRRYSVRVNPRA